MRPSRYTIGQVMLVIAVFAGLLAAPRMAVSSDRVVMVCVVGLLTALVVLNVVVETFVGKVCPACAQLALRRLARHRRYYGCLACGGRFKRYGLGPWQDASGPEDAARFRRPAGPGMWKGFTVPQELGATTSGRLLQSKRTGELADTGAHPTHASEQAHSLAEASRRSRAALEHLKRWQG